MLFSNQYVQILEEMEVFVLIFLNLCVMEKDIKPVEHEFLLKVAFSWTDENKGQDNRESQTETSSFWSEFKISLALLKTAFSSP